MKSAKTTVLFLLFNAFLLGDPWGKDADLCQYTSLEHLQGPCATPIFGAIGEGLIYFHQNVISPADGPRSHFIPSSSQYTLEAMRKYGFFYGYLMGCDRLMRENSDPWIYRKTFSSNGCLMKSNPVP